MKDIKKDHIVIKWSEEGKHLGSQTFHHLDVRKALGYLNGLLDWWYDLEVTVYTNGKMPEIDLDAFIVDDLAHYNCSLEIKIVRYEKPRIFVVTMDQDTHSGEFCGTFSSKAEAKKFIEGERPHYHGKLTWSEDGMSCGDGQSWGTCYHIIETEVK